MGTGTTGGGSDLGIDCSNGPVLGEVCFGNISENNSFSVDVDSVISRRLNDHVRIKMSVRWLLETY